MVSGEEGRVLTSVSTAISTFSYSLVWTSLTFSRVIYVAETILFSFTATRSRIGESEGEDASGLATILFILTSFFSSFTFSSTFSIYFSSFIPTFLCLFILNDNDFYSIFLPDFRGEKFSPVTLVVYGECDVLFVCSIRFCAFFAFSAISFFYFSISSF